MDPVTLGLCSQIDLDLEVQRASRGRSPQRPSATRCCRPPSPSACRPRREGQRDEEKELDADAVFAKLSSLKAKEPQPDDE